MGARSENEVQRVLSRLEVEVAAATLAAGAASTDAERGMRGLFNQRDLSMRVLPRSGTTRG